MSGEQERLNLTEALKDAALNRAEGVERFYLTLLDSTVWVPLKLGGSARGQPLVGEGQGHISEFLSVEAEGRQIIPIFSGEEFVDLWAEREQPKAAKAFRSLLWLLSADVWLHLDPGQEFGKEISPWEISRLKEGINAVQELVSDAAEGRGSVELEISALTPEFDELKKTLREILEIYESVEEAFLIGVKEEDDSNLNPLLGLKLTELPPARREALCRELIDTAARTLPSRYLSVADDLGDQRSPNQQLFAGCRPFYIAQKQLPPKTISLVERLRSFLGGAKPHA